MSEPPSADASAMANIRRLIAQFTAAPDSLQVFTPLWVALATSDLPALLVEHPDGRIPATYENLVALGNHAFREQRYQQAADFYAQAQQQRPDWPFADGSLAYALATLGRHADADAIFRRLGERFAWPYGNLRLGESFWRELHATETPTSAVDLAIPNRHAEFNWQALIAVDSRYLDKYALAMARSFLRQHASGAGLHLHVVNPTDAAREQAANLANGSDGRIAVSFETKDVGTDRASDCRRIRERRAYFACTRFLIAPSLLEHYRVPLMILDADLLVKRPLDELIVNDDVDVGVTRFPVNRQILWQQYFASLQVFRPTSGGQLYATLLARYLRYFLDRDQWIWPLDQAGQYSLGEHIRSAADSPTIRVQHFAPEVVLGGTYFENRVGSMSN